MVDVGRVLALLERLQAETEALAKLRDSEALPGDETALAAAKYRFIVAIETCIDVAEHVISSEGLRQPDSFARRSPSWPMPGSSKTTWRPISRTWRDSGTSSSTAINEWTTLAWWRSTDETG